MRVPFTILPLFVLCGPAAALFGPERRCNCPATTEDATLVRKFFRAAGEVQGNILSCPYESQRPKQSFTCAFDLHSGALSPTYSSHEYKCPMGADCKKRKNCICPSSITIESASSLVAGVTLHLGAHGSDGKGFFQCYYGFEPLTPPLTEHQPVICTYVIQTADLLYGKHCPGTTHCCVAGNLDLNSISPQGGCSLREPCHDSPSS